MNVMYAMDDNYVEIAGVSMESLLDKNREVEELRLIIVTDGISNISRKKLRNTAEKYGREIIFIEKPDIRGLTGTSLTTLRWSDSAFSRLYADQILKEYPDIDKVLYLDCDTLVMDNLEALWNTDIREYVAAGVLECMGNWHKRIIGIKPSDNFFNSGVLLMNIDKWRNEHIAQKCTDYIRSRKGKIEYVDQGVVNGVLTRRMKVLNSPRYNLTALSWDFSYEEMLIYRKPDHGYSKQKWERAKNNPAIIHFTTSFLSTRPWYEGSHTPYTKLWRMYKAKSEWEDEPLRIMKNKAGHDKKIWAFNFLPRRMAVSIAGILHSYFKPIAFKVI